MGRVAGFKEALFFFKGKGLCIVSEFTCSVTCKWATEAGRQQHHQPASEETKVNTLKEIALKYDISCKRGPAPPVKWEKKSYYPHCGGQIACKPHSPFWMVTMSANLEAAGRPDPISKHKHFCLGFGWGLCTALPTPTSPHPLLIGWDHQNLEDTDVTDSFPREHIHAHLLPPTRLFIYPQGLHLILVRK